MKKILYIGEDIEHPKNGGDQVNKRNRNLLQQIFGVGFFIYPLVFHNKVQTFTSAIRGYLGAMRAKDISAILQSIKEHRIDIVFFSSSLYGKAVKKVKEAYPDVEIIVFFHNIEKYYMTERCRIEHSVKNIFFRPIVSYNEKLTCAYGDKLIVLNQRDANLLETYYGRKADLLFPISFSGGGNSILKKEKKYNSKHVFTLLFVGSAFFANIQGVTWFIQTVLPELDECNLLIVGKGMEKVFTSSPHVKVKGYVQDLEPYYQACDLVIAPIFSGGGMKIKTAEAMMYGCPVVGTPEAFEGYDIEFARIGGMFRNKSEVVKIVTRLKHSPSLLVQCSLYSRSMFEQKYSSEQALVHLKGLMNFNRE